MSYIQLCNKRKHEFTNEDGTLAVFQPDIEVIAFALCHINRFTGHVGAYSVAQHSIHAYEQAKLLAPLNYKLQLSALLHDATEAYINDIASPLKALLPDYQRIEDHYHNVIDSYFGIETRCQLVKEIDMRMLAIEAKKFDLDMILSEMDSIGIYPPYLDFKIMKPNDVYEYFMTIYNYLEQRCNEEKA